MNKSRQPKLIPSTVHRRFADQGHRRPANGLNNSGGPWTGCSRVPDRAARRRANRITWRKLIAAERRRCMRGAS